MTKLYKKDFCAIAFALVTSKATKTTVLNLCDYLETTNSQFDKSAFLKACEVTQ